MRAKLVYCLIVGLLAWGSPPPRAYGATDLLIYAVCKRDRETIALILADKKDVSAPQFGAFRMTALDLALANGFADIVNVLLHAGATPTQ